jgi:hypothetical protein
VTVLLNNSNYTGNILILFLDLSFNSSDRAPKNENQPLSINLIGDFEDKNGNKKGF